ncbi:unnamed protein product [Lactuca virosa]|uniref:Uncharacterized protein n=1 Tax=Lactuca virosa TaxID=75947 RepID=A0AAU9LY16_9ASTR|nr:unnamed protein product [Lactuca virosa]
MLVNVAFQGRIDGNADVFLTRRRRLFSDFLSKWSLADSDRYDGSAFFEFDGVGWKGKVYGDIRWFNGVCAVMFIRWLLRWCTVVCDKGGLWWENGCGMWGDR